MSTGRMLLLSLLLLIVSRTSGYPADANRKELTAPRFTQEPPASVLFSNSTGTSIPCAGPGPSRWVLSTDGQPLRPVQGLRTQRADGALVFSPFAPHQYRADVHAAVYRCLVEMGSGLGIVESRDVRITAVLEHPFEFQVLDQLVTKGGCALLHCPLPTYVTDYVTVTHWEVDDGTIVRSDDPPIGKYVVVSNGDLFVRDVTELDSARGFRCHAASQVSPQRKYVSENFARLIVAAPQQNAPPRISTPRSSFSVPSGSRAVLGCCAPQGWPTPVLRWREGGRRGSSMHGGLLVVEGVARQDAGTYSCFASNALGEDRMDVEMLVNEDVTVSIYPSIVRMSPGHETILNCTPSVPGVGVQWRRGGRPLPLPPPHPRVLRLAPPTGQGAYQCFAVSADGSLAAQSAALVLVADIPPRFTSTFPSQTILPGESTTLRCTATGSPAPRITWSRDGRPTGASGPSLAIERAAPADAGLYACRAANGAGAVEWAARVNVRGPPFVRTMENRTALAGRRLDVECPYGGWPVEAVVWKKEGRLLPVHQRQRVHPNGTLTLSDLQAGVDDGLYSCHVTAPGSDLPPASQQFHLTVKTAPKVSEFFFRDDLSSGERTAVTCVVRAGDAPVVTRWLRDGLPVSPDPSLVITGSAFVTTLSFEALDRGHAGNYTCVADNEAGSDSYSAMLTVRVPPGWVLEPTDSWAVSGRPARMDCQADGVPMPHVRWKMATGDSGDYQTIVSSSQVHILVNGSLNFRAVAPSDAGAYLCEAANGLGAPLSALVRLRVHSPPKFASKFTPLTARRGEKVTFTCQPEGDHPMTFSWRKNGVPIDPLAKPRYSQKAMSESGASLVVERAEREDSASFTCAATNDFGQDDTSFQFTVLDVPDAPQNLEVHDVSSRTVRLTWNKPFDGNSPILKYSAQWRRANGGEPPSSVGPVVGEERSLVVRGLRPRTRYLFRVRAENALGTSQFGAEVAADTLQEPPRNPPVAVRAVAVSSRAINVTWQPAPFVDGEEEDSVDGFYVGFRSGSEPFTFRSVPLEQPLGLLIEGLRRDTPYTFLVQPYNARGAGPPSQEVTATTKQFDIPATPSIKSYYTTSQSIKLSWEINITPDAPVTGFRLFVRAEGGEWSQVRLRGEVREHVVRDLQCGTRHQCYLQAFNAAATSHNSQPMHVKTDGGPPVAPDKRHFLWSNSSCAQLRLQSWQDGGCPIRSFAAKFRPSSSGRSEWTLVSNHLVPQQREVLVPDLAPGQWWALLITARNDAGDTDAEYMFATLTLHGELPPRPSDASEGLLQRHLLVVVPVASATLVLLAVLCVVCVLARRRGDRGVLSQQGVPESCIDPSKGESLALHSTFEGGGGGESTYFPAPHRTFAYTYDVPYPNKQMEKSEPNYESPILYFPGYTKDLSHRQRVSSYGRNRKTKSGMSWRREEASGGSSDSEGESRAVHREERLIKEECRESETECDRIWKSLEECKYEANQRWAEHAVSVLT